MKTNRRIIIIILIQTLVLMLMIANKQWTLSTGTPVILETQPVDPRSLFRGDYVRLNYKISQINLDELDGVDDFRRHDEVFVLLEKGEPYWQPVSLHREMPLPSQGQVAIAGKVKRVSNSLWNTETRKSEKKKNISVKYGIENYFVPEGTGLELERPSEGEKVSIKVSVDKRGKAGIKAVLLNNEERYVESLF